MTTFLDGPAEAIRLMLKTSPMFLRVVHGANGKWDALDLPSDEPRKDETVYAYRLSAHLGNWHINMGRKGGGFYPMSEYRHVAIQPDERMMGDGDRWAAWIQNQTKDIPE